MTKHIWSSLSLIFLLLFRPTLSCDERACRVGVSSAATACGVGAAVGGGILCAVTFGIGCAVAVGVEAACAIGAEVGSEYGCPQCGTEEAEGDSPFSQLVQENREQHEVVLKLHDRIHEEQQEIKSNQQRILSTQDDLLFGQAQIVGTLDENHKENMRAHLESRRLHYQQLAMQSQTQNLLNNVQSTQLDGFEKL